MTARLRLFLFLLVAATALNAAALALEAGDVMVLAASDRGALVLTPGDDPRLRFVEAGQGDLSFRLVTIDDAGSAIGSGRIVVLRKFEQREVRLRNEFALDALASARLQIEVLGGNGSVSVTAFDASGRTFLPRVNATTSRRRAVVPAAPKPATFALIEQAEQAGTIDSETALLYRVYSLFGDARLPSKFKGDDSGIMDSMYMADVRGRFSTLSPATQAAVQPFLTPPAYKGSWANTKAAAATSPTALDTPPPCQFFSDQWAYVDAVKTPVRIWYRPDVDQALTASQAATEIDNVIWSKLTGLMKHSPLSDQAEDCNGGSPALDVYLTDLASPLQGLAIPYGWCGPTAAYVEIVRSVPKATLAHEIFHAIQDVFPMAGCPFSNSKNRWWIEGSAMWTEDFVYPDIPSLQSEHQYAYIFLIDPGKPLNLVESGEIAFHAYGTYLLPFFIHRSSGSADFVRTTWENVASQPAVDAADKALSGGFEKVWPDFTKHNWNRKPVDDYQTWDKLTVGAKETGPDIRTGTGTAVYNINYELAPLSASYHRIVFKDDDSTVVFWNGVTMKLAIKDLTQGFLGPQYVTDQASPEDTKGAHVTALIRMGESWKEENWTNREMVVLCRDLLAERVDELVLVISNSEFQDKDRKLKPPGIAPVVYTSNMGCWRWKGNATLSGGGTTASADVTWTREEASSQSLIRYTWEGSLAWSVVQPQQGGCNASGSASLAGSTASLITYNFVPPENKYSRSYLGAGGGPAVTVCGSLFPFPWMNSPPQPIIPGIPLARFLQVSADGKKMDDSYSLPGSEGLFQWHFVAQRQ